MFDMKKEYYTGVQIIDEEHMKLFNLAEEAYILLNNDYIPDKFDNVMDLLNELKSYTKKHFSDEEEYMRSINYKRIYPQKVAHRNFIAKLDTIDIENVDKDPTKTISDLLIYLADWLVDHIINMDLLITS